MFSFAITDLLPVDVGEEGVRAELGGAGAAAAEAALDVAVQEGLEEVARGRLHRVVGGQLDEHGEGHAVDLELVLGLVLAEGGVALEQLVEHAAEREPVGGGVVGDALGQHFRRHVAVRAAAARKQSHNNNNNNIKYEVIIFKDNKCKIKFIFWRGFFSIRPFFGFV